MKTLVIGLGNPLVTDDSVGLRVVERLKPLLADRSDVEVSEDYWGGLRLMERMIGFDRAIVIDAIQTGALAGHDPCSRARGNRHPAQRLGPRRESPDRIGVRPPRRRRAARKRPNSAYRDRSCRHADIRRRMHAGGSGGHSAGGRSGAEGVGRDLSREAYASLPPAHAAFSGSVCSAIGSVSLPVWQKTRLRPAFLAL